MRIRLEMTNYNLILREKQEKIDIIISNINKSEYLTGETILPSDQCRTTGQDKFTYSRHGIALKIHTKTIEDQGKKQETK